MTRLELSHSVKNVTQFESPFFSTRLESESPKILTRVEPLTRVTLSLVCGHGFSTENKHEILSESDKKMIQQMYGKPKIVIYKYKKATIAVKG